MNITDKNSQNKEMNKVYTNFALTLLKDNLQYLPPSARKDFAKKIIDLIPTKE